VSKITIEMIETIYSYLP